MIEVHPSAVIDKSVELADGVSIGPNCVVGANSSIGRGTVLWPNVVVGRNVNIGRRNHLYPNCVIGYSPQILGMKPDAEFGALQIGDDNTIRENVTIHPSMHAGHTTRVGNENLLMIGVHIGHDCNIEDKTVMSNFVQVSGHCKICTGVWLSGMVLLHQFITVGRWVYAAGLAGLNHDVPPFVIVSGHYPVKVRGINKRGLKRAGLSEAQQDAIMSAYKKLYRQDGVPLLESARKLAAEDGLDENVRDMVDVIIKSSEHRYGRYLETFR